MRRLVTSLLVLGAISATIGVGHAQKGLSTGPNLDGIENDQHDALSAMARECQRCPDAKIIADNLIMLDRILVAATKKPAPAG